MAAPTLQSARLTLRPHVIGDYNDSLAMWSDPGVVRYIGNRPFSAEEVWARLLRYFGLWPALGYGYWVIVERESGRFAGEAGIADFRRETVPPIDSPESGWALMPWANGKGYATEALGAILSWADTALESRRTLCMIQAGNATSVRVAQKCGYTHLGEATHMGAVKTLYERARKHQSGEPRTAP